MTKLLPNQSVVRESATLDQGDPLIVEIFPRWIEIRTKGKRARVTMTYEEIVKLGRKITWQRAGKKGNA